MGQTATINSERRVQIDYSLVGINASMAVEKGLSEAAWYQCPVPRETMRKLLERRDGPAIRDTLLRFVLLFITAAATIRLRHTWWAVVPYISYSVLYATPADSRWHEYGHGSAFKTDLLNSILYVSHPAILDAIQAAGYDGAQFRDAQLAAAIAECVQRGLGMARFLEIRVPSHAAPAAEPLAAQSAECGIIHLGYGLEDDNEAAHLIEAVIMAAERFNVPLYIETHRSTLTQDIWRTLQFAQRFPALRFNGDFSHWYNGQEMVYGDFDAKLRFMAPVLERVRFLHGRIGNPGCSQVDLGDGDPQRHPCIAHFKQIWSACFAGFLASAKPTDFICFTPELLNPEIYYARVPRCSRPTRRRVRPLATIAPPCKYCRRLLCRGAHPYSCSRHEIHVLVCSERR